MGWTNSVPIFHNDITFILQPEISHNMLSFIDDIGVKGPKIAYMGSFTKFSYHCHYFAKFPQLPIIYLLWLIDGDQSRWSTATYSVFWSEQVTVHKQMGCSPYFATTGIHPLLPADIVEAAYLQPLPNS
ncbi:hypothetical protein J132_05206 [Termitomyces sp. J132]|nr:hypothetical protein J132_05206 [Termitomyces sp. J132]